MPNKNTTVAINDGYDKAGAVIKELHTGFNMKQLQIVGKDCHADERTVGYCIAGGCMEYCDRLGINIDKGDASIGGQRCRKTQHAVR